MLLGAGDVLIGLVDGFRLVATANADPAAAAWPKLAAAFRDRKPEEFNAVLAEYRRRAAEHRRATAATTPDADLDPNHPDPGTEITNADDERDLGPGEDDQP